MDTPTETNATKPTDTPQQAPAENPVKGWNWGAFFLNWIWGLGNRSPLALLCLIPIFGIVWMFVTAAKADKWAWKNGNWQSAAQFRRVQKTWSWVGFGLFIFGLVLSTCLFASIGLMLSKTPTVRMAVAQLNDSRHAIEALGSPIKRNGIVWGNVKTNAAGGVGSANINFSVAGPNGTATVYVSATRRNDQWVIHETTLKNIKQKTTISAPEEKEKLAE